MRVSAPARIDLAGGTLDVPPLCHMFRDCLTVNLAIDRRVEVTLVPSEDKLLYAGEAEPVPLVDVPLFAKALAYLAPEASYNVHTLGNIPAAAGLGGSSTLLVALVKAITLATGQEMDHVTLLERVTVLEHRLLGKPAGTQDAIAAIYGGLSEIHFEHGKPEQKHLKLPPFLQGPLYLAYSKQQHHSGINNWGIIKAACENEPRTRSVLAALNGNAHRMTAALQTIDRSTFFDTLKQEAVLRSQLCEDILTPDMQSFSNYFGDNLAAKICGAGGGGCMFLFGDVEPSALYEAANRFNLEILTCEPDTRGLYEIHT